VAEGAPAVAARLFARLPAGWSDWQRAAAWPGSGRMAEIVLELRDQKAPLQVLVAGRVESVAGAVPVARADACTGRGCAAPDAVQRLTLLPQAREVRLRVTPLDTSALAAMDAPYRHLVAEKGQLRWQALAQPAAAAAPALSPVVLSDRDGKPLWGDGVPTAEAREAGLATLLGLRPEHAGSVAGMLARMPSPSGSPHAARLSIDSGMQRLASAVLDCVALRRGQWTGSACVGGAAPPAGRQAGLVIVDTDTGDLLAAASSPGAPASASWAEVRDFDRANPAASVLRVPALQHDGGVHRSPGSTFKVVTALGLELAAQRDRRIDALLAGRSLADIDRSAREAGFGFHTGAPAYPADSARAHITNFREQLVTRRAQDGQLGMAQALAYSINTWFAWTAEMSDQTLFGKPDGGLPGLQSLDTRALGALRPVAEMAQRIGFEQPLRLDGGLLPADYPWSAWDVLQPPHARMDPIHTRHEVRQMAIGLRMQATPLQMALAAGAVGQGRAIQPRLLLELDGRKAEAGRGAPLGVRLDRVRAGMKGVVDHGTAAGAFRAAQFDRIRPVLYGKTGTAPTGTVDANGRELATVWFTGWLEPGALPGQRHRLAFAVFASHSEATGGEHVAPAIGGILRTLQENSSAKQ
jgi:cell division protein FtsI/penicillin-binding protein 2